MNYKIISQPGEPLHLRRRDLSLWLVGFIFGPISLPALLICSIFVIDAGIAGGPGIALGVSLLFSSALLLIRPSLIAPREIRFDPQRGIFELWDSDDAKVTLATLIIERFGLEERVMRQQGSGRQRRYVVQMHKYDGARWTLYEGGSRGAAEALYQRLQDEVPLTPVVEEEARGGGEASRIDFTKTPFQIETRGDRWAISWEKEKPLRFRIGIRGVVLALMVIAVGAFNSASLSVGMILLGVAAGAMAFFLMKGLFLSEETRVEISEGLLIAPKLPTLFNRSKILELSLDELAEISFSFGGNQGSRPLGLQLFSPSALEQFRVWQVDFPREPGEIFALFQFFSQLPTINTGDLCCAEIIQLEQLLQEEISARTGQHFT
ncbi:MAG: hypothetical protein VYD19_10680 [Myxococcota bacterium]|nr:hypothetical protein [Myxococcota bacterium]